MSDVTLDPHVLSFPLSTDVASLTDYAVTLSAWSSLFDKAWIRPLCSVDWEVALDNEGRYPYFATIAAAFAASGVVEFDAPTVFRVIARLTDLLGSLEQAAGMKDLTWASATWSVSAGRPTNAINDALNRTGVAMAISTHFGRDVEPMLATMLVPSGSSTMMTAGDVMIEEISGDIHTMPNVSGEIRTVSTAIEFILSLDPVGFMSVETEDSIRTSIQLEIYRRRRPGTVYLDPDSFRFGPEFVASIVDHRFGNNPAQRGRIVTACADAVLRDHSTVLRPLRTGRGAGDPQRKRNEDIAWRRDVDYDYRLHYWESPTGLLEFGRVNAHEDFRLP